MLISVDWIKDFVSIPENKTAKDIGNAITLATAEVEEVITSGDFLAGIKVVEIVSLKKHPEADKLNLVTFKVDDKGTTKEVVCGASNVREGLKVPYACVGTTFPSGLVLTPKKIRGVESNGMLCSEEELGIGSGVAGLMELPSTTPIGQSIADYLQVKKDIVLNIDNKSLTHRPDLWGHYGFAREFATIFHTELKQPFSSDWVQKLKQKFSSTDSPVVPQVNPSSAGLIYLGLSVDNITVGESPSWLKNRLTTVGLRSINNIVDISNYVMIELGIPLHIFDRDQISGKNLFIREAREGEVLKTLDGVERALVTSDTVIADEKGPLVLAGIMGGETSGVSSNTHHIFIEVANWAAARVRKTSSRLGLRTDSSQRYEKTLDSSLCERTLLRTLELICELCPNAKVQGKIEGAGVHLESPNPVLVIDYSYSKIKKNLGKDVSNTEINYILTSLGMKFRQQSGDMFSVEIPSFRATKDIYCGADLVEEVGRFIGYDNIVPVSPRDIIRPVRLSPAKQWHRKIQDFCINRGRAFEVMTYPLVGEKLLKQSKWETLNESLALVNALSVENDRMRPSIVPSFLQSVAHNSKYYPSFRLFELGRSYLSGKEFSQEKHQLVFACFSESKNTFIETADLAEELLASLSLPYEFCDRNDKFVNSIVSQSWSGLHPHEFFNIKVMGKFIGTVMTIHPLMMKEFKMKGNLSLFILDITELQEREIKDKVKYRPLPKFPSSTFDCTIVMDEASESLMPLNVLRSLKLKEITGVKIVSIFPLDNQKKSVTLRTVFQDSQATLTAEFLKQAEERIVSELSKAGFFLKS